MTTSTSYPERGWREAFEPRREPRRTARTERRERSAVIGIAVAVAAAGVIGYLGYAGATAPKLRPLPPDITRIQTTFPAPPVPLVKLELGLAEP